MSQLDDNIAALPELAYAVMPSSGDTVIIKRGEMGYHDPGYGPQGEAVVKNLNDRMGVTPAQAAAMFNGSLFGWHTPAANPDAYDDSGQFKVSLKTARKKS
ncbi:hypothetical protein CcrColossus_gp333 [Caulobacter phage CcrColossus]|uniref:Uncharacterized protein n=1 Tax=Caulobacter phage CcrColossus TaxID=1211640 RepID=K4JWC4_9CAUD|nr:hypothetical protein CcrColossus_gp333 [Caulobacter phage CcrColossus]AFU88203.1 hypothetical protein CcrColossus_gp333 [Caulobacter phage CcrColossus]